MTFSEELLRIVAGFRQRMPSEMITRESLINHFKFLHQVIIATGNLLSIASQQSTGDLKEYFLKHYVEEFQHPKWLAADLLTVGVDVTKQPIDPAAMELVGSMYYMIFHVDPIALLGYLMILESSPTTVEAVDQLAVDFGQDLVRTLRYHVENDPGHLIDLRAEMDRATPLQQEIICQAMSKTLYYIQQAKVQP